MKSELTSLLLTFVLGVFAVAGAILVVRTVMQTRELKSIGSLASSQNNFIAQSQALLNDVAAYNAKSPSPELTRILQGIQAKPVAR